MGRRKIPWALKLENWLFNVCEHTNTHTHVRAHTYAHARTRTLLYLKWRLQVVFIAFGKELVGIGCRPVLIEVFQVLQVGTEVLLSVATDACKDELGLQLRKKMGSLKCRACFWLVINPCQKSYTALYLEETEDYSLMGFWQDRESLLIS